MHDELFELVPKWYLNKLRGRTAIIADLARLLWAEYFLRIDRADVVVWMDADVLLFAPDQFAVQIDKGPVFGCEYWVQSVAAKVKASHVMEKASHEKAQGSPEKVEKGSPAKQIGSPENIRRTPSKIKVRKNVHNAYCAFRSDCTTLPFLINATQRIIERIDSDFIAPQIVGPKLVTSLHNIVGFELEHRIGAVSPQLHQALLRSGKDLEKGVEPVAEEIVRLKQMLPTTMLGANLCTTLSQGRDMDELVDILSNYTGGLG